MALFTSYAPPGVYTQVILQTNAAPTIGSARVPVIIGEGQQYFSNNNVELFRGSSSVQDDQSVSENISNQVTGLTRSFQTSFYPVTTGNGKGVISNNPADVQVEAVDPDGNVTPVTVISLNGATGQFSTQLIIPSGYELLISYFFKRGDTFVGIGGVAPYNIPESLLAQVPSTASQVVGSGGNTVTLGLSVPGLTGNLVTLQFVDGPVVPDALAVSGAGTDAITINITKPYAAGSPPVATRTLQDLINLINAGIPTLDGGYLTVTSQVGTLSTVLTATAAVAFTGGAGGNSNTVFKVSNTPITDGTNGGVVTTNPANVIVQLNGNNVAVTAVDGQAGLITLAQPVSAPVTPTTPGANVGTTVSLTVQYYFNTWQNTYDLLPGQNIASINRVGLGPNRSDFTQGTDYVLGSTTLTTGTVVQTINWGASVSEVIGQSAAGESANFTPSEVQTTLVDEHVYLRPLSGAVNGKNMVFSIPDTPTNPSVTGPTDGSGLSKSTDDPTLIQVYVGTDPLEAFLAGAVTVASLSGVNQLVTLYNPPQSGNNVYASYYRNTLSDHTYTVAVVTPGYASHGTYIISDELDRIVPLVTFTSGSVAQAAPFDETGLVFPNDFSDAQAQAGAAVDEVVTLTFNPDGYNSVAPAVQAYLALTFGSGVLTFTAQTPGVGGNLVQIAIDASSLHSTPVVISGDKVTIYANWAGTPLTLQGIANLFPSAETADGGQISCVPTGGGYASTTAATNLANGANAQLEPYTHSYTVSSSLTKGGSGPTGDNIGYLDQTYEDLATGFRVTIVNPSDHASYGVPSIAAGYSFTPFDTLTFTVAADSATGAHPAVRACGTSTNGAFAEPTNTAVANNQIAIQGLYTTVTSNFGSTSGDTVLVSTFRGSGNNPNIGEFYYVSYTTAKTAADYAIHLYTDPKVAYAVYGPPTSLNNRVSVAIQLMAANGVQTFGVVQVPVVPGTNQGTSQDFMNAIQSLTVNLPGLNQKANIICPLSTDPVVHQFLSRQLTTQANVRQKGEAIGFVGYDQFSTPSTMSANAESLSNARMIAIGTPVAGILITNPSTGVAVEYAVSGEFMAAAMMGLEANPSNDVATSLTFQNLVGFSRLLITYDDPTMDNMASNGLTCLLNNNGALLIRHYKSTDPSNPLTSEPTCTTITDYVSQQFRVTLKQFIGRKLLDSLVTDIQVVCNALLTSLVNQQIIAGYQSLSVVQDPTDPTQADVTVTFKPIFSLLYVSVVFTVQTQLS